MGFNDLGRGKLGIALAKLTGVADDGALRSLSPELAAVVQLPISVEELMGAGGFGRWAVGSSQAAVAGQNGRVKIRNPVGSGVIVIVEAASFAAGLTGTFHSDGGYADTTDLASSPSVDFRDGRQNPRTGGAAIVTCGTAVGSFTPSGWNMITLAQTEVRDLRMPMILGPGNSILWGFDQANSTILFNIVWRERGATPAELARQ